MSFLKTLIKQFLSTLVITSTIVATLSLPFFILVAFLVGVATSLSEPEKLPDSLSTTYLYGHRDSRNKILSIPIQGEILSERTPQDVGSFFGLPLNTYGYELKSQLAQAAQDKTIKAIILQIDSPGGTVIGSQAISDGLNYYRSQTHAPVFAHISGLGASGAYWVAATADKILVDPGSSVGSIGVVAAAFFHFDSVTALSGSLFSSGVTTKNGITFYEITAGRGKDIGNPFRAPTSEELSVLQTGADINYQNFISHVAARRHLPESTLRDRIGALIYDHQSALNLKLVDQVGSKEQAYQALATAAGIASNYQVVTLSPLKVGLSRLFSSTALPLSRLCLPHQFLYYSGNLTSLCSAK